MLGAPPRLWEWLTTRYCPVPRSLSWCWWRAIYRAQWSGASAWRARFLDFESPNRLLSADIVEDFFDDIATPRHLISLLEELRQEKILLARDAMRIEEELLTQTDAQGRWKHGRGRKQPA